MIVRKNKHFQGLIINLFNRIDNKRNLIVKSFNIQNNKNFIRIIVIETNLKNKQVYSQIRLNQIIINQAL